MSNRRRFIASLARIAALATSGTALAGRPPAPRPATLIQRSPLAGFQYHEGGRLWAQLRTGQNVALIRETDNRYDPDAVRIDWAGHTLGYLPRVQNTAISQMLDRGETLAARIAALRETTNPWQRMEVEVWLAAPRDR